MPTLTARYPSLQGRSVFISGGASGIGATLVEAFFAQGARVGFVDIDAAAGQALADRLAADAPGHAPGSLTPPRFIACDITDTAALQAAIARVAEAFGPVRVLLNNAANDRRHTLAETTPEDFDRGIAVNLKHQFFAAQAVAPGMRAAGGGAIVNLGSISWQIKSERLPVYVTAKAAIHGLTRGLARELGPHGIRVNTLLPGWVMTEKQQRLWLDDEGRAAIARHQCLPGPLLADHIAAMALFLAADDSAMCTAQDFTVDGGWS